jgi:pimeloyl-ACP methyl ester carboxylesterase
VTALCRDVLTVASVVCSALMSGGCGWAVTYSSPQRMQEGYTIILPGIEGASYLNMNIAAGLKDGGLPSTIEVYDWTLTWAAFPANLRFYWRNQEEARKIAGKIMAYQDAHPGKPVHLIGHSGGGGVALLALEALPANRRITSAILLAPAVAPDYDLRRALRHTEYGIWNYYSPYDVGFLKAGTLIMGTIEGKHTVAAGAEGFRVPWNFDDADRRLYAEKLHQQRYTRQMAKSGHFGDHGGWAARGFVRDWLAPILLSQAQPYQDVTARRPVSGTARTATAAPPPRQVPAPRPIERRQPGSNTSAAPGTGQGRRVGQ